MAKYHLRQPNFDSIMIHYSKKIAHTLVFIIVGMTNYGCVSILPDPHKIDIHQGNIVDSQRVEQLQVGMSREQVKYLLGSPVSNNLFRTNRWDYLHYVSKAGNYAKPKRVTVFFDNGVVSKIENQYTTQ